MRTVLTITRHLIGAVSSWMLLLALLGSPRPGDAQATYYKETAQALEKTVHLRLGSTTLAKTLSVLSEQTGLRIQAADYLKERQMLVQLGDLSAADALSALAECYDWVWYERNKGHILVMRPAFIAPQNLTEIATAFRAIVPKDLRRFIGLDVAESEIRAAYRQGNPNVKEAVVQHRLLAFLTPARIGAPVEAQRSQMQSWLTPEVKAGKKLTYADLSPEQRHSLIVMFVCEAMQSVFTTGPNKAAGVIRGLDPSTFDETQMLIQYSGNLLLVGTFKDGRISFGESINPADQDPLRQSSQFGP